MGTTVTADELDILYADNHLLVVVKPAGVLTQGDATGDASLLDAARAWIRRDRDKPGNVYVGLVHRLDRPACGVVVLARTSKAASRLSDQLRRRTVDKRYWAVVAGRPTPPEGRLTSPVEGKPAVLTYRTLATAPGRTLLAVRLETGRKHQIRRQLAELGHPVLGDLRYGAPEPLPGRAIALLARSITIEHPTRREPMRFEAPPPPWWPLLPADHGVQRQ